jgi:uncharacterized protein YqjF (DUF2071 family)
MSMPFLTAEWRDLLLFNWAVDPSLLAPLVPAGTELDPWEGDCFVSAVGFQFRSMAVMGVPAWGWRNFPEINLRFYIRRKHDGEWRRGVGFVAEVTPHRLVGWIARSVYGEPYQTWPMQTEVTEDLTEYRIRMGGEWAGMGARPTGSWMTPDPAAQETFFIEHYWGYTRLSETQTSEYEVAHPSWRTRSAELERFDLDVAKLYGPEWADLLSRPPDSVVLAEGSEIAVHPGRKL